MIRCLLTAVFCCTPAVAQANPSLDALIATDQRTAAGELALDLLHGDPAVPLTSDRKLVAALDLAAERAIRTGQLDAAQRFLEAAAEVAGPAPSVRHRVGDLFRRRALNAAAPQALDALRAAWRIARRPTDRAMLADHLAQMAIVEYAQHAGDAGDALLSEARHIDPRRPQVVHAASLRPKASPKARAGLLVIVIGVGFFALRRLKRVLLNPPKARRRERHLGLRSRRRTT